MKVSASQLRADIYNLLDRVVETGEPLEIERGGRILRVVAEPRRPWTQRLVHRPEVVVGDPGALPELSPAEWSPE